MPNCKTQQLPIILSSFVAGVASVMIWNKFFKKESRENAGAITPGNDLSLYYSGDITSLTTITPSRKFLPSEVYGTLVRDCVVCCVDIVLVNKSTKQTLLVQRSSEPVKGVWWWPGGRLLKGETFFAAAQRKAQQETGITNVTPVQVLGVWNTFFPTSAWDNDESKGTQTVNAIVLVEMNDTDNGTVKLDNTSEEYKWIDLDPQKNTSEDKYVQEALLRLQHWDPNYMKK